MAGIMVVFDFDRTIIDNDSDRWIIDQFDVTKLFKELYSTNTMPWNPLVNRMVMEIQSQGRTIEDMADCLRKAPLHPQIITAIKSAHALGCELRIASDANVFYIETILKHHGLLECFSEINTNPIFIDEQGRLKVLPYHDSTSSPHGCSLCSPHMCKGKIMERIQDSMTTAKKKKQFIYIGDGGGDYCPTLKLSERDYVMPRLNYPLWKRICSNRSLVKADIHDWSSGEELQEKLLHLINMIIAQGQEQNVQ